MPYSRVKISVVNVCHIREPNGGNGPVAIIRGLPDRPGTYGNATAYAYPAAYVRASGSAAPNDPANSDAAPNGPANSDAAPNGPASSDAAPDVPASFGIHTQHSKRPMG